MKRIAINKVPARYRALVMSHATRVERDEIEVPNHIYYTIRSTESRGEIRQGLRAWLPGDWLWRMAGRLGLHRLPRWLPSSGRCGCDARRTRLNRWWQRQTKKNS